MEEAQHGLAGVGTEGPPPADPTDRIMRVCSVVLMMALLSVVMLQVVSRYLLPVAPMWVEELPGYLLVWLTALGACMATKDASHVRIEILADALPDPLSKVLRLIATALGIAILSIVFYYGIISTLSAATAQSVTMRFPMSWIHVAIPTMAAVCIVFLVINEWRGIRKAG